jgi:hypothetical protein
MLTHFLATLLGKKSKIKIQSTNEMGSKGDDDKTDPFNQGNISHPTSVEELKQQLEAKFNAVLKAFLESCTKDRRDKVTQYKSLISVD